MAEDGVEAVDRALTILGAFREGADGLTLHEVAQSTGFYKSTILRLCASLERFGYLHRSTDGRFRLGAGCLRLGSIYQSEFRLDRWIRPALETLAIQTHETASFYVREGEMRVCLFRRNSTRSIRHNVEEGSRLPLDRGAPGLILLAFAGDAGARFVDIRRNGYAVTLGGRDPDAAAVSVPVFAYGGVLSGALAVTGLRTRFTPETIESIRDVVCRVAHEVSAQLGQRAGEAS
jgi:DNA-binding IclR family transcriptional regulator